MTKDTLSCQGCGKDVSPTDESCITEYYDPWYDVSTDIPMCYCSSCHEEYKKIVDDLLIQHETLDYKMDESKKTWKEKCLKKENENNTR